MSATSLKMPGLMLKDAKLLPDDR